MKKLAFIVSLMTEKNAYQKDQAATAKAVASFPSRSPFFVFLDTLSNAERGDLADQR